MKKATENMQTVAVYSEPRIKTYGFHLVTDLFFIELLCSPESLNALGQRIEALGDWDMGFHLVFGQIAEEYAFSLFILTQSSDRMEDQIGRLINGLSDRPSDPMSVVDVVFFQGPHFGDRYGIAHAAFQAMEARSLPLLASVCSGACLYLVFSRGKGAEAEGVLRSAFEVPQKNKARGAEE
ncbi:hypothetical protein ACFL4N_04805 [Thermodesulfobacteriota bacterium]